jgi:hypothetical protein
VHALVGDLHQQIPMLRQMQAVAMEDPETETGTVYVLVVVVKTCIVEEMQQHFNQQFFDRYYFS